MALRIRKDGRILCAAIHPEEAGDTYIDDTLHYEMSAEHKVLVTEEYEQHQYRGEWWWSGNVPAGIVIAEYYLKKGGVNVKEDHKNFKANRIQTKTSHDKSP